MPLFEYQCTQCHYGFDKIVQRWDAEVRCPLCRGKVEKQLSSFSVGSPRPKQGYPPAGAGPKICNNC